MSLLVVIRVQQMKDIHKPTYGHSPSPREEEESVASLVPCRAGELSAIISLSKYTVRYEGGGAEWLRSCGERQI